MAFSRDDLRAIMDREPCLCISMYLPTAKTGREARENPIRFKNVLRKTQRQLLDMGIRTTDVDKVLAPAERLLQDDLFWLHQGNSLAVLVANDFFRYYHLPTSIDELVVITNRFHVKPLLSLLAEDRSIYILSLSQKEVRLWHATRRSLFEIELEGAPLSIAEVLRYDDKEKQAQYHTAAPVRQGEQFGMSHGHGVGVDDQKTDVSRFLNRVDAVVRKAVGDSGPPMVLATVEYLFPLYKSANAYANLVSAWVSGNPEGVPPEELRDRAWSIVEPVLQEARRNAHDLYWELVGTGKTSKEIADIVPAAHQGRISDLFISKEVHVWGTYDPDTGSVSIHESPMPGDQDLLDLSAVQTLLNNGEVYAVADVEVPERTVAAAILRY